MFLIGIGARLKHPGWMGAILPLVLTICSTLTPGRVRGVLLFAAVIGATWVFASTEFAQGKIWRSLSACCIFLLIAVAVFVMGREFDASSPATAQTQQPQSPPIGITSPPTKQPNPSPAPVENKPVHKKLPEEKIQTGSITQGECSNLLVGGNNNQATTNCVPEWHFSDAQRSKWTEFVKTLPPECAQTVVVGDIPDKNSQEFASHMYRVLEENHKANRLGHLWAGTFGEGVGVQVHDESDVSAPTAQSILSGMQSAGIPVIGLSADEHIRNHEIHIIVAYKPSK